MKLFTLSLKRAALIGPALGFLLWSGGFVGLYAMQSLGCAFGWDQILLLGGITLQRTQLVVALLLLLAGLAVLTWLVVGSSRAGSHPARTFLDRLTAVGLVAAFFATAFTFGPAITLSACNGLP